MLRLYTTHIVTLNVAVIFFSVYKIVLFEQVTIFLPYWSKNILFYFITLLNWLYSFSAWSTALDSLGLCCSRNKLCSCVSNCFMMLSNWFFLRECWIIQCIIDWYCNITSLVVTYSRVGRFRDLGVLITELNWITCHNSLVNTIRAFSIIL